MACDDLRIGGTLSASGISGGVSISDSRIAISDWSGVFGHVGYSQQLVQVSGRPGGTLVGDALALARFITLPLLITRWATTGKGSLVASSYGKQLWDNTDLLLGYLANPAGFYLEIDDPESGTRFTDCYVPNPAPISQTEWRRIAIPIISPWPYWREGGNELSLTGSGAGTLTVGGNVNVYDAILTFSGAGTFTNSTAGWTITVSAACVVNLGAKSVTVAGVNSDNLMTARTSRDWGWFEPGNNTLARSVSVGVTWRDQFE